MDIALSLFLFLGLPPLALITLGAAGLAHFLNHSWARPLFILGATELVISALVWANEKAVTQALFPTGHL
ncbi:hypothetical protein ABS71_05005 [bacterium SCN 62-11]|nr:hypothetical protein [Candidatus Eremiobacteraeota bacterium]ODT74956.1 MAG: hypothetical protein ABS71_05005 [bacterium SCN 62-11]